MRQLWRLGGSVVIAFGLILPFGELTGPLMLLLLADGVVAVLIIRTLAERRAQRRQHSERDARLALLRRTVPHLRHHRPTAVIEMQIRWRARAEAAAARRRGQL
jgi:hypothetical protein